MSFTIPDKTKIYTVSELNSDLKNDIENLYSNIFVEGEISNFAWPNKKHMYFSLADEFSIIKTAMFERSALMLEFTPENGMHVIIGGSASIYPKRSEYQIIADKIIPLKEGNILIAFEQLKNKLQDMGLFNKQAPLPRLPGKIGVVTSKSGAVIKDIANVLNKRFDNFNLILRNTTVQGSKAAQEIIQALDDLEQYGVDVIIIARGGGSFEDLMPFNDEELAKRIYRCNIPVISAIGHETDFTICDFVADMRAATPTQAAEMVIINKREATSIIRSLSGKMSMIVKRKLQSQMTHLKLLKGRKVILRPQSYINLLWQHFDDLNSKLASELADYIIKKKNDLKLLNTRFMLLSPLQILEKGYCIILKKETNTIPSGVNDLRQEEEVKIILKDGQAEAKITKI